MRRSTSLMLSESQEAISLKTVKTVSCHTSTTRKKKRKHTSSYIQYIAFIYSAHKQTSSLYLTSEIAYRFVCMLIMEAISVTEPNAV